jgi:exosortase/archaeosortase family protein
MKQKAIKQKYFFKWLQNPFFIYILITIVCLLLLLVYVSQASVSIFLEKWTTILLNSILNLIHIKTRMNGNLILLLDGSQIKFQIIPDCTGIYPLIILISLMAGFPVKFLKKIIGLGLAIVCTFIFNYVRLVLLFIIGRASAKWFEIAHLIIWQISFVLFIVLFFFGWMQWAKKTNK